MRSTDAGWAITNLTYDRAGSLNGRPSSVLQNARVH
ncbi:hypothetical protein J6497_28940 [Bradyrhizobium sp. CNPSo 4026]|nr:hypothetical protein [Bradyrhizobium cenepequi]